MRALGLFYFIYLFSCLLAYFLIYLFIYLVKFRLQRKNSLLSQAMESCCKEFDALLGRLAITREDIDKVLSPLTSYASQNSAHSECTVISPRPSALANRQKSKTKLWLRNGKITVIWKN